MIFVVAVSGVVPGTAFTLLTYLDMQGTSQSTAGSAAYSVYLKVSSVTLGKSSSARVVCSALKPAVLL